MAHVQSGKTCNFQFPLVTITGVFILDLQSVCKMESTNADAPFQNSPSLVPS